MKTEFLSIATHQLRTPISAMRGYASLILEGDYGPVPEGVREPLARINESGRLMNVSIEDYLNVSRIESGRVCISPQPLELVEFVTGYISENVPLVAKKKLQLVQEFKINKRVYFSQTQHKIKL